MHKAGKLDSHMLVYSHRFYFNFIVDHVFVQGSSTGDLWQRNQAGQQRTQASNPAILVRSANTFQHFSILNAKKIN